jgi:tripartite-type tricarboxylate transporter receptor subunit TctC
MSAPTRRRVLQGTAALLALPGTFGRAQQAWPANPVTLVVQAAPGGSADQTARMLSVKLGERLRVPIIVSNEPAASGMVAVRRVVGLKPDGYTLLLIGTKSAIAAGMGKTAPFDLARDFEPIAIVNSSDLVVVVPQASPLTSVNDLVKEIRAKPGKVTLAAGDVSGGIQHLGAALFKTAVQGDLVIVPYGSTAKLTVAVRSGEVHAAFELLPAVMGQIRAGELRVLATTGQKRNPDLPNVPTLTEAGFPNSEVVTRTFLAARAGTPAAVLQVINTEIGQVLSQPDVQANARLRGTSLIESMPAAATRKEFVAEIGRWRDAVRRTGLSVE